MKRIQRVLANASTRTLMAAAGLALLGLMGCAATPPDRLAGAAPAADTEDARVIRPFSSGKLVNGNGGWSDWAFHPTKPATRYRLVEQDGAHVLEARADSSVSGLMHPVNLDPLRKPMIEWRWRIDGTLDGADIGERHADDSPARLVLSFDGDPAALPLKEQMFAERVKLITGQEMPYATLMYVWDNQRAPETVTPNAHTSRVRKIVVQSGSEGARTWKVYQRDIVADFTRAFGEPPGKLIAVGVMTDSDNTKQKARCLYGDIRLLERKP